MGQDSMGRDQMCIVTGASRGIGAATARLAAIRGYAVVVNYLRSEVAAHAIVAEIEAQGGRAAALQANIGIPDQIARLFEQATERFGPPTALVNNAAAAATRRSLLEIEPDDLRRALDVDLAGPILCMAEAARRMSTLRGGAGGAIVNVSSQAARTGGDRLTSYVAAKAGLEAVTLGLARELGPHGIRVNAVSPGVILTERHRDEDEPWLARKRATIPLGRLGTPEEVADAILWLLSPASAYVTGTVVAVNGGR
jgi:NAD(P)-dependent dehydrogenase (short-subunit alcohol dehydrogenase family)